MLQAEWSIGQHKSDVRQRGTLREHLSYILPSSGRVTETVKEEERGGGLDARAWVDDEGLEHRHVVYQLKPLLGYEGGVDQARYSGGGDGEQEMEQHSEK